MDLSKLKQVIPSYKWRVQSVSKNFPVATCVAYIDAREVMDILDETVGPENWQSDFKEIKGNLYAGIGIRINDEWVWKWDCGTKSNTEPEKGEASDAFKRAAVKWGVGRFLYEIPVQYVKTNEKKGFDNYPFPIDDKGNKVKDLTEHINSVNDSVTKVINKFKTQEQEKAAKKNSSKKSKNKEEELTEEAVPTEKDTLVHDAINIVWTCKSLEELRKVRELYPNLESKEHPDYNPAYKQALKNMYEILAVGEKKPETVS